MRNKKILIVNAFFSPWGGAEIIAYNTYKLLKKQNFETYFWASDKKDYFEKVSYDNYFSKFNVGINNYIKNPLKYYYNYEAKKQLNKFIHYIKPDLIHVHSLYGITNSVLECCKNVPTIMTLHDASLICPSAELLYKNNKYCEKQYCKDRNFLPCIFNKCSKNSLEASIRHSLLTYINNFNLKYVNKFITPSHKLRELFLSSNIGIATSDIKVINNFLPQEELEITPNLANKGYFLFIGRLSKEKGVHYLLKAMKDLPREIEVHIVGKGAEENKLKQYAKENNLDNVKFLGFKNREEIKEEYQNCIATILPCNWFENFPTTNMESFINGKPVIASNIGGIPEQVEHNKTGLLFEPTNVEQLKECIIKYWNNPNLVVEHGKNAYEKAKKQYTEERYYNKLMKVYEEVLSNAKQY